MSIFYGIFWKVCVRSNCGLRCVWCHGAWVSSGADSHDAGQEIPCSLRHPQVTESDPTGTPLDSKLSEINPAKTHTVFCLSMCNLISLAYRGVYRVLLGKPDGRRLLGRPRRRWVDNIRMDVQEVRCGYMDWIGLTQDRDRWRTLVSAVINLFISMCNLISLAYRTD